MAQWRAFVFGSLDAMGWLADGTGCVRVRGSGVSHVSSFGPLVRRFLNSGVVRAVSSVTYALLANAVVWSKAGVVTVEMC